MKKEKSNYKKKFIKNGIIKLQNDLPIEFGLWTGSKYYELKDILKYYIGDGKIAQIKIKNDRTNEIIFNGIVDIPTIRIEKFLEDILLDVINTKVLFSIMRKIAYE